MQGVSFVNNLIGDIFFFPDELSKGHSTNLKKIKVFTIFSSNQKVTDLYSQQTYQREVTNLSYASPAPHVNHSGRHMLIKVFSEVSACWVRQVQMAHTHVHVATASSTPRESLCSQICLTSRRPPLLARAEVLSHPAGGHIGHRQSEATRRELLREHVKKRPAGGERKREDTCQPPWTYQS